MNAQEKQQDPYEPPGSPPPEGREPGASITVTALVMGFFAGLFVSVATCFGGGFLVVMTMGPGSAWTDPLTTAVLWISTLLGFCVWFRITLK